MESDEEMHGAASHDNPDLFYRLKLKLWNRNRMTNAVRTPYDKDPVRDVAHWKLGTRVVINITEEGDAHAGKAGRLVDYRGNGWYAVLLEDGHKATFSPMQWERTADQKGQNLTNPPLEAYRAAHRAVEATEGKQPAAWDSSPGQQQTPAVSRTDVSGSLSARSNRGDAGMGTPSGSQSNPPQGTRVRIIRTYGGLMLPKEEVRKGETQSFAHGWYYILDENGKKESCRRNSFVVVGDEEDIELGFFEGVRSGRKGHFSTPIGDGGSRKDMDEEGEKEATRTYPGKKRGRKPNVRVEESGSEDDDSDDEEGEVRKKGKKAKENKEDEEARVKREKEEEAKIKRDKEAARRQREKELEEREREKEREKERERERIREEEAKAEANMTQEDRDALEAARLAAMLNRNPRRRGGGDAPPPGLMPRIPLKRPKEKKEKKENDEASKL